MMLDSNGLFRSPVLAAALAVGCGGSGPDAPTVPTPTPALAAGSDPLLPPPPPGRALTAAEAAESRLEPAGEAFNAYDFYATYDDGTLQIALVEDEMRSMREASKPHRNRLISVEHCPVEPHHALQTCGEPIWTGTRMLAGRIELPPISLAACDGWIVAHAAELYDDNRDGWRNAPCPTPGGGAVGSDGAGDGWPDYPPPPAPEPPPAPAPEPPPPPPAFPGVELFDASGPYTFVSVSGANVRNILAAFYMIDSATRADCPAAGTAGSVSLSASYPGGTTAIQSLSVTWGTHADNAVSTPGIAEVPLSSFTFRGGSPAHVATDAEVSAPTYRRTAGSDLAWEGQEFSLVGPANDPLGFVSFWVYARHASDPSPLTVTGDGRLPPSTLAPPRSWYVVDNVDVTAVQTSPPAPATGYCVIPVASRPRD